MCGKNWFDVVLQSLSSIGCHFNFADKLICGCYVTRYRSDAPNGRNLELFKSTPIKGLESSNFVSKQIFYHSKDGTRIPMFILHHKNFKRDGTAPGLQYGYVSISGLTAPTFSQVQISMPRLLNFVLTITVHRREVSRTLNHLPSRKHISRLSLITGVWSLCQTSEEVASTVKIGTLQARK